MPHLPPSLPFTNWWRSRVSIACKGAPQGQKCDIHLILHVGPRIQHNYIPSLTIHMPHLLWLASFPGCPAIYRTGTGIPYCPGQAPMGHHSSSAKNWGWAVTWRWFNYSRARAYSRYKVSCQGIPDQLSSCFVEASLTAEKAVLC